MNLRRVLVCSVMLALLVLVSIPVLSEDGTNSGAPANASAGNSDPLVKILVAKGVITAGEANFISTGSAANQRQKLLFLLKDKGLLSTADIEALQTPTASSTAANYQPAVLTTPAPPQNVKPAETKPAAPKVVPAVAPLRVLQLEPSKKDGLIPDIKLGSGANLKLYGFIKASAIYDSSDPYGTDMPLPGFLPPAVGVGFDSGPDAGHEFHVKARFARVGANFEWPDPSKKLTFTGKLEFDFEGNFTKTLNRNISTVRSSQASIRLAYGRLDYKKSDKTSYFMLFGQDWTPFGSSTLPNLVETTGLGLGYGTLYERAPQFRGGMAYVVGGSRKLTFAPEFAIVMPAYGNTPANVVDQLGYGERQGADSGRPEIQGRFVTQWQLDKAPGVVPAQFIVSFMQGARSAIITKAQVPTTCPGCPVGVPANVFTTAFPTGVKVNSDRWGLTGEIQLPTRYVTMIAKYWTGTDLRFYFVGSLFSEYNAPPVGMVNLTPATQTIDGAVPNVLFGLVPDGAGGYTAEVVPQKGVRSQGGFINLGFPLGRIFDANPSSRLASTQLFLHYAFDNALARDARAAAGNAFAPANTRNKNDLAAATLMWKANSLVTFALEESYYRTRMAGGAVPWGNDPALRVGAWPNWMGKPARSWHDLRSEFSTIFTF